MAGAARCCVRVERLRRAAADIVEEEEDLADIGAVDRRAFLGTRRE